MPLLVLNLHRPHTHPIPNLLFTLLPNHLIRRDECREPDSSPGVVTARGEHIEDRVPKVLEPIMNNDWQPQVSAPAPEDLVTRSSALVDLVISTSTHQQFSISANQQLSTNCLEEAFRQVSGNLRYIMMGLYAMVVLLS
jgi:hypothetical protein